jgi:hypothetical protein
MQRNACHLRSWSQPRLADAPFISRAMQGPIRLIRRVIHTYIRSPLMWHRLSTSILGSSHDIGFMVIATDFITIVVAMVMGSAAMVAVMDSAEDSGLHTCGASLVRCSSHRN